MLPRNDWAVVDALLCDILTRVRERNQNPFWTFEVGITQCYFNIDGNPVGIELESFLPDFQALGGVVEYESDNVGGSVLSCGFFGLMCLNRAGTDAVVV
jgi:hypothetical protein